MAQRSGRKRRGKMSDFILVICGILFVLCIPVILIAAKEEEDVDR